MYYMTKFDDTIKSGFRVISKITSSANFCKTIPDITNQSTSICPFESGKCRKEGKKLQKLEYLENEKSFLDEIKFDKKQQTQALTKKKLKDWPLVGSIDTKE